MSGFAVDIGDDGSAYEQGVNMPSVASGAAAIQGISAIGKGVFGVLDSMDAAKKAAQPTESAINREAFASLSSALDGTKGASPLQKRNLVNSAIAQYNSQGFEIGEAEARMIKQRTGINVDFLNFDPQQAAIDSTIEKISDNPAYLYNARKTLETAGKPYTDNDVLALAMSDVQRTEAAALYIANAKNVTRQEFLETYVPQANLALDKIRSLTVAGLEIEMEGGNITPDNIARLRAQYEVVKSTFTKPPLIEAGDWQVIQSQVDTLSDLITTLEGYDQTVLDNMKADILQNNSQLLMKMAKSIEDPILRNALLSDKIDLSYYFNSKLPQLTEAIDGLEGEDIKYTDLYAIPEKAEGEVLTAPTLHDPEELSNAQARKPKERVNAIMFAGIERIGKMTPVMMDDPVHRDNFFAGVGQATVNISSAVNLLKEDTMNQVYNDDTYAKLALARILDPQKTDLAVDRLIDGLQSQANIYMTTMKGQLEDTIFTVSGVGEVAVDTSRALPRAWTEGTVQAKADQYYDGNIYMMFKDMGRKLAVSERTELRGAGFDLMAIGNKYNEIVRMNDKLKYYSKQAQKLGVNTSAFDAMILDKQEGGITASLIESEEVDTTKVTTISGDISVSEQEAIYNNLPSGALYIDPADGKTYRKP